MKRFELKNKKFWFFGASGCLLFLVAFYTYNLYNVVFNAAERAALERRLDELQSDINRLEFELISSKNQINLELAYSLGFRPADRIKFIPRQSVAAASNPNI